MDDNKKRNIIEDKTFIFAIDIVNIYKWLVDSKKEFVLSKQLLRAGTSIGANVQEAQAAQTKKDFIAKMAIASKEARETKYWLRILTETNFLNKNEEKIINLIKEIQNIIKILSTYYQK
ncbi:MAG: four helix bundle protein [Desulfobacterales bacterium]|nr:four helix bundle protein [Desulfobacterales bacterium]MBF0397925.1 four helix bundle protein [Desulfobacterales bacterium]